MPGAKGVGPAPKTAKQRAIDGSRSRPHRQYRQPEPVGGEPVKPAHLTELQAAKWDQLFALLRERGQDSPDLAEWLENAVQVYERMITLELACREAPLITEKVMVDGTGQEHREPKAHPIHVQARLARRAYLDALKEAGLTPATLARVKLREVEPAKADPFTAHQQQRGLRAVK